MNNELTQGRLKELVHYDKLTGIFTRLVATCNRVKKGDTAGSSNKNGYLYFSVESRRQYNHRLAFLYVEGYFPEHHVDHKNGKRDDNRWSNLRHVSRSCNFQNQKIGSRNTSGYTGVAWNALTNSWRSYIGLNKKLIYIGLYPTPEEAAIARVQYEDNCPEWTCNYRDSNTVKLRSLGEIS